MAVAGIVCGLSTVLVMALQDTLTASNLFYLLYGGLAGLSLIILAYLIRRDRGQTETHSNAAINAAWTAAGFGIFAFWIAATIVAVRHQSGFFMNSIPLLVLAVYGIAWWVAAVVSQQAWMKSVVAATYLGLLVVALAIGSRYVWLAYALALLGTALLPGLRLVRTAARERSAASAP